MRKVSFFHSVIVFSLVLSGCASLNANTPFRYQSSLLPAAATINKSVGVELFKDKRPKDDIIYTKSISDVAEKITAKLLEDFKDSKLFREIHYSVQPADDITVTGTIERFTWKLYAHPLSYIPLLCYLGTPNAVAYGLVSITLEVKDNKTGTVIRTFKETAKIENLFSVYNFKVGDGGTELEDAFREVGRKLKEDLLSKVNWE